MVFYPFGTIAAATRALISDFVCNDDSNCSRIALLVTPVERNRCQDRNDQNSCCHSVYDCFWCT